MPQTLYFCFLSLFIAHIAGVVFGGQVALLNETNKKTFVLDIAKAGKTYLESIPASDAHKYIENWPPLKANQASYKVVYFPQNRANSSSFDMINMLCRVNRIRQAHGLYPVVYHHQLMTLAQKHARFQSTYRVVTHADDAGQIGDRLSALGFQWGLVVENVGAGINDDDGISDAWENSSGHLANILHPDVRYMGVDVSRGYWVQDFASPLYKNYVVPLSSIDPCPIGRVLNIYN